VTDVVQIPRTDAGTEGEGQVLPHGVIGTSSDLLCSWPLGTTRDECGECSIES
jgi:hypothetical protein